MNDQNPQPNPKKLFVGNISWSVSEEQLSELFGQYGKIVDIKLITDRMSGRSKGIAFVEYETEEEAQAAIEATNDLDYEGRKLVVNVARPPSPRQDRGGYGGNRSGGGGGYQSNRGGFSNNRGSGSGGGYRGSRDNSRSDYSRDSSY